jgi:hypothetical protein
MTKPLTQIGDEVREMTDEEYAAWQVLAGEAAQRKAAIQAAKDARQAVLDKLGLTANEAAALLG